MDAVIPRLKVFIPALLIAIFCNLVSPSNTIASADTGLPELTIYNYAQRPVYAWPVELETGERCTAGLGAREMLKLPAIPEAEDLEPEWQAPELTAWMPEEWQLENTYGRLRNGVLEVTLQKQRFHIGVPRFQGANLTPFVHPMVSPIVFSGRIEGRAGRFSTELFSALRGRVYRDNGWSVMEVEKELDEAGEGVTSRETFRLHPVYPVLDYALSFSNRTDQPLSFVLTHASGAAQLFYTGEFLEGQKVFHCNRKEMRSGVLDDSKAWISVQSRFLNPSAWAVVEDDGGYSLGVSTRSLYGPLFGAETKWIFPENRMVLDLPYEDPEQENGRPIVLYPDRIVEAGIRISMLPPAANRPREVGAAFRAYLAGNPLTFASPFAVYRGSEPVEFASLESLEEMQRYPDLWHLEGGALRGTPEGLELQTDNGALQASLAVRFPADRALVVQAVVSTLDAGSVLELELEPKGQAPRTLAVWEKPGAQSVEIPGSGDALKACLIFRLKGSPEGGAVLAGFRAGAKLPPAPEPVFPLEGASHIPAGVSFRWRPVADVLQYELELASFPDFAEATRYTIEYTAKEALFGRPDRGAPGDAGFFPKERLSPGIWYWRTRAVASHAAGTWSTSRMFTVREPGSSADLRFPLSPTNILFCSSFHVGRHADVLDQATRAAGPKLRNNVVNRLILETVRSVRGETWTEFFASVAGADGQFMIQPGHSGLDLSLFETALQQCPNIIGFCQGELFWGFWDFPDRREVTRRILELCAEYGSWFLWGDGQEGAYNWLKLQEDPEWQDALNRFGRHLIPTWKMNLLTGQFTTQGTVLGMQQDGLVKYTGAWPESFYWSEVGFGPKVGEAFGRQKGKTGDMPPPFWIQNYLLGVAQGAVAFVNHDAALLWSPDGTPTETWTRQFQPFLEFLDQVAPPPDAETVHRQSRRVWVPPVADLEYHEDYGPFAELYRTLYSLVPGRELIELIPDRPDYRPIALVRKNESGAVPLTQLKTPADVLQAFPGNVTNPKTAFPAWVSQDPKRLLVMNPSENTPGKAGFTVHLGTARSLHLQGELDVHTYLMAMETDQGIEFLINGRADTGRSTITFSSDQAFSVREKDGTTNSREPGGLLQVIGESSSFPLRLTWLSEEGL